MRALVIMFGVFALIAFAMVVAAGVLVGIILSHTIEIELEGGETFFAGLAAAGMLEPLGRISEEHYAFGCSELDGARDDQADPDELAAALGLPRRAWTAAESGNLNGVRYIIILDPDSGPVGNGISLTGEFLELPSGRFACLLPTAPVTNWP